MLGSTYALIAIGLSLIYGVLGVINFAHGELFAVGAYFALFLWRGLGVPIRLRDQVFGNLYLTDQVAAMPCRPSRPLRVTT